MCGADCSELSEGQKSAWIELLKAHAKMTRACNRAMEAAGVIPLDVYDVLVAIEMSEHGAIRMSDLADAVLISRSGLTRLADRLETEGYIERVSCPKDRRATHIVLTDLGRAERERAWPIFRAEIARQMGEKISPEEANLLGDILRKIND